MTEDELVKKTLETSKTIAMVGEVQLGKKFLQILEEDLQLL